MSWNTCLRRRSISTVRYYRAGILGANKKNNGTRQNNQYSDQDLNTGITEYGVEVGYGQVPWNEKSGHSSET
jgi:hypothetical protein